MSEFTIPGPESQRLLDDLARYECPAITARRARRAGESGSNQDPIVWAQGSGARITDVDGHEYLDFTAAFAVSTYGHAHPRLVKALSQQASKLMHGMGDTYPSEVKIRYAKALADFIPGELQQSIFGQSGAEAVEAALKTAWVATGRRQIIAFRGAYHGLSVGALAASGYKNDFREPFAHALARHIDHAPYPYCYRCPYGERPEHCKRPCVAELRARFEHNASGLGPVAAVIVEPIQGRGGVVVPPEGWLAEVKALCERHGALMILDEIFTGFGRTGKRFAFVDVGVEPDLLCVGKAMTGGFPLSAVIGRPEVMEAWGASEGEALHTSTFLGNPMACAVGLEALAVYEEEGIEARIGALSPLLREGLLGLRAKYPRLIGEVRGRGLMHGAELIRPDGGPNTALSLALMRWALEHKLLLLPSGLWGQNLTLTPPAVIDADDVGELFELLDRGLEELSG